MDDHGIDADDYIAAIRAGALDPHGFAADELQASLDAFDRELTARFLAMSAEEVEAGAPIPPLRREPEPPGVERLRLDEEFVDRMRSIETRAARIEGERRALMAAHMQRLIELAGDTGPQLKELAMMAAVEIGLTGPGMAARMTEAWTVVTELPAAHEAAAAGRITTAHLRIIAAETRVLRVDAEVSPADRARVIDALVEVAEGSSTSVLRSRAKRVVNEVLSEPLQVRHDTARQQRRVELFDVGDGMADIVARVPAVEGSAMLDRLTEAARRKSKDDPRTFDQFRADAFVELMLAGVVPEDLHGVSPITAHVAVTIPAMALLDSGEDDPALRGVDFPALLDGKVLVDAETARRIAGATAVWERLFTDPVTGVAVTVDTYRASAAMKRVLAARDGHCRGPDCGRAVLRADLDHTLDFAKGGTTSLGNLGHLCRSDHRLKHDTRWAVEQRPGGAFVWTSPIGQVITSVPEPIGPVFTDMPRRPPKATPRERRQRRKEILERSAADRDRLLARIAVGLGPEPPTGPPPPDPLGTWSPPAEQAAPSAAPPPF